MKKYIFVLLLPLILLIALPCHAFGPAIQAALSAGGAAATCGSCQGAASCTNAALACTFRETFDGTTSCYSGDTGNNCDNTWTVSGSSDLAHTSHPIQATRDVSLTGGSESIRLSFTAADVAYAAAYVYITTHGAAANMFFMANSAAGGLCSLSQAASGAITVIAVGGSASSTIATVSDGTGYYFKTKYTKGTGADAICEGWVSSDGKNWGTSQTSTNGTATTQVSRLYLYGVTTPSHQMDDIRVFTGDISW